MLGWSLYEDVFNLEISGSNMRQLLLCIRVGDKHVLVLWAHDQPFKVDYILVCRFVRV